MRLDREDRAVLGLWAAFLVAAWTLAGAVGWLVAEPGAAEPALGWAQRWGRWDFVHYQGIADHGYTGEPTGVPNEAFFPALPLLLAVGQGLGLPGVVAGGLVSAVAGAVAAVALGRIARGSLGRAVAGRRAVLVWVLAPPAVFLAAPYTESLFLGLALPAWLAARSGHWRAGGLLAAAACAVRVSGVFLVAALVVAWLVGAGPGAVAPRRRLRDAAWLLAPVVVLGAWMAYLRWQTGDWLAWLHAQEEEWNRSFTWPWTALQHTWDAATGSLGDANFTWMFRAELVALAVGVAVTAWLLWARRWAEATWVGLQVAAFATSYWFFSVPRATLLWWPLWVAVAGLTLRRPWLLTLYVAVSAPLAAVWAVAFLTSRWAG